MGGLPLDIEARIEAEHNSIRGNRRALYPLIFPDPTGYIAVYAGASPHATFGPPSPANLKLQFRDYGVALFDVAAREHKALASGRDDLRGRLEDLALAVATVVTVEAQSYYRAHDHHCSASDRRDALDRALNERVEFWLDLTTGGQPATRDYDPYPNPSLGERMDAYATRENISHEELAARIGISRSTYFTVKRGGGNRSSRRKTEIYLDCVDS